MMIKKVTLSTGKIFDPKSVMPKIATGDKVGIFYSGGILSTLLALMAIKKYTADKVVFILLSMDAYTNTRNAENVRKDFRRRVELIGGMHTIELTNEDANTCDEYYETRSIIDISLKKIRNNIGGCKHIFTGYSLIHRQSIEALEASGWDKTIHLRSEIANWFEKNNDQYPELKEYIHECGGELYFTTDYIPYTSIKDHFDRSVKPLVELSKHEVIELYHKFKLEDKLSQTVSCNKSTEGQHCGQCKNCKQRQKAFKNSGFEDFTTYLD